MNELQALFGVPIRLEDIADCRVTRIASRGVALAVVHGLRPTWLRLTLHDGRRFETKARGPGSEQAAIDAAVTAIAHAKASETEARLAQGAPVAFGRVFLSTAGITAGGRLTAWQDVGGWTVRGGGFLYDDARGSLAGEVMLADIPFGDALVEVFVRRLPERDYERMGSGDGPKIGFFTISARTRIPGTFKYQKHLFLGVVPALALLFVLYAGYRRARLYSGVSRYPNPVIVTAPVDAGAAPTPPPVASPPILVAPASASAAPSATPSSSVPPKKPKRRKR